ncbi:ddx27 [Symbiodinium natans]|uniref:Ddx27 protein n=1 Tax=Symbiodinium natans TaxID=878477 RepID=A0A812S1B8_9DINO|nr:ddx27 [Symbiodinium natans]
MDTTLCLLLHANGLNRRVWAPIAEDLAALRGLPVEALASPRPEASLTRIGRLWLASLDLLGHGEAAELHLAGADTGRSYSAHKPYVADGTPDMFTPLILWRPESVCR